MLSMPPDSTIPAEPALMISWASMVAFMPEPQTLLTVVAPVASGSPAPRAAWRAGGGKDDDGIGACGHHGFSCSVRCYMTIVIYKGIAMAGCRFPQRGASRQTAGALEEMEAGPAHPREAVARDFGRRSSRGLPGYRCVVGAPLGAGKGRPGPAFLRNRVRTANPAGAMTEKRGADCESLLGTYSSVLRFVGRISTNDPGSAPTDLLWNRPDGA